MVVLGPFGLLHEFGWARGPTHLERPIDVIVGNDLGVLPGEPHAFGCGGFDVDDVGFQLMCSHCLDALGNRPFGISENRQTHKKLHRNWSQRVKCKGTRCRSTEFNKTEHVLNHFHDCHGDTKYFKLITELSFVSAYIYLRETFKLIT